MPSDKYPSAPRLLRQTRVACCGAAKDKPPKAALFITVPEGDGFMEMDRSIADSTKDPVSAFDRMSEVRLVKYRREAEINDVDRVILLAKRNNDIINAPRDASDGSTASHTRRTSGARILVAHQPRPIPGLNHPLTVHTINHSLIVEVCQP